jgi:hypothetical protein
MFSDAVNFKQPLPRQAPRLSGSWRLEGLRISAEPCLCNAIAANTPVYAACNGLNFGQFWHCSILG